jgi:hypothetical protein
LFVGSRIEISNLSRELRRDDAVCGDEGVGEGGFAMVLGDGVQLSLGRSEDVNTYDVGKDTYL